MARIISFIISITAAVVMSAGSCGAPAPAGPTTPPATTRPTPSPVEPTTTRPTTPATTRPTTTPPPPESEPEPTSEARVYATDSAGVDGEGNIVPAAWSAPTTLAPNKRVIEVVDKVKPTAWNVRKAVNWLDKYTASDMRLVARCSGKAYRCITVKQGKVKGAPVGWSSGRSITIDTNKAKRMGSWYRADARRTWLLIHELGHQHGLGHSSGRNVMNPYVDEYKLVLTTGQRATLRKR